MVLLTPVCGGIPRMPSHVGALPPHPRTVITSTWAGVIVGEFPRPIIPYFFTRPPCSLTSFLFLHMPHPGGGRRAHGLVGFKRRRVAFHVRADSRKRGDRRGDLGWAGRPGSEKHVIGE